MYKYIKRGFDFGASLCLIIVLSPFLLILYTLLRINVGGAPGFYLQPRYGIKKTPFVMYKFKTMIDDHSLDDALRVTKFSTFVRNTGLDELPQLFNILKGDMSFVGPRPFMINDVLPKNSYNPKRYLVKPGVFGLAQANGRRYVTHNQKIAWDLEYVDRISFMTDLKVFFKSIWVVIIQLFDK